MGPGFLFLPNDRQHGASIRTIMSQGGNRETPFYAALRFFNDHLLVIRITCKVVTYISSYPSSKSRLHRTSENASSLARPSVRPANPKSCLDNALIIPHRSPLLLSSSVRRYVSNRAAALPLRSLTFPCVSKASKQASPAWQSHGTEKRSLYYMIVNNATKQKTHQLRDLPDRGKTNTAENNPYTNRRK